MKIKRFLFIVILSILMICGVNVKAATKNANITSEYSISNDALQVKDNISITNDLKYNNIMRSIEIKEKDEIEVSRVIIEDENGIREIKPYGNNTINEENYSVKKGNSSYARNNSRYDISINFKELVNIKNISIDYSYKKITNYDIEDGYAYIGSKLYSNVYNTIKVDNQIIKLDKDIKGCWIGNGTNAFSEEEDYNIITVNPSATSNIIFSVKKDNNFLSSKKDKIYNRISHERTTSSYTKLFENYANEDGGLEFKYIVRRAILILLILVIILSLINKIRNKGKGSSDIKNSNINNKKAYRGEVGFKLPEYINPAYLGILFNTSEEDIIFTITLELIRKGAIEIVENPEYRNKKDNGVYRKYILKLTEEEVDLLSFEELFIEKVRDIDEINLINLEDIQNLVGKGYFDLVVSKGQENYNEFLSGKYLGDLTLEEILKEKNIEYDKWKDIKNSIKKLKIEDIEKLKLKDIELLHVFSTGLGVRSKDFPLFKLVNSSVLRASEYFTIIQQKFDDEEVVLNYLERTFIR